MSPPIPAPAPAVAAFIAALKLQTVLELRLGEQLADDEVTHMTLHVARMADDTFAEKSGAL
ncbi:hypothetical protein E3T61_21290 [Cryobacterium lactosi]|uniref:Uncharacterized protein n=1 Tax=Cryobacterium lactosi TaxID=1259202 RepID=A0A4R9BG01_9MICO|nr:MULTISPECIES: hypothetical protein [Cryobacterium]TFD83563.1 hypothetical protein E3T61_21290 [Cryobacterium lactosi]